MDILQSSNSFYYKRPFNSGNKVVDVVMRNHNWNGAIGKPLEIKYSFAHRGNIHDYLSYKDSFFTRMDCTFSAAFYRVPQLSDPVLYKMAQNYFGDQIAHQSSSNYTNNKLNTDFLYYAEDTFHNTMQGNFESSKAQCEYSKLLIQENFKKACIL